MGHLRWTFCMCGNRQDPTLHLSRAARLPIQQVPNKIPNNPISETTGQQAFIDERDPRPTMDVESDAPLPEVPQFPSAASSSGSPNPDISIAADDTPMSLSAKEIRASPSRNPRAQLKDAPPSPTKRKASPSLSAAMKRNNVTGKGVALLEKIAYPALISN